MAESIKCKAGGITVEINPERLADVRVQVCMGRIKRLSDQGEEENAAEIMGLYAHMLDVMLDDADGIMDKLAAKHSGVLTNDVWGAFFQKMMESATVKNS